MFLTQSMSPQGEGLWERRGKLTLDIEAMAALAIATPHRGRDSNGG